MDDPVVITGTGAVCSLGQGADAIWGALLSGASGIGPIRGFDASGFPCRTGAQVGGLDPGDLGIHPRDARIMGVHSHMLMKCAGEAFQESGLAAASIPKEEIGFFAGMGMVDYAADDLLPAVLRSLDASGNLDYDAFYSEAYKEIYPLWPLSMLNNISFCQIAISLDIRGENTVFSPHADSGAQAIGEGVKTILDGKSRAVMAGGVSETINPFSLARGHLSGTLSKSGEPGELPCRPFAADRTGTVMGEGCGVLALERSSSARERGASCLASIRGYGAACEPEQGFPGPTSRALAEAMEKALDDAGSRPDEIDALIAHGDGTRGGDGNETEAIRRVFSGCVKGLPVYSSKGAIGNLLAGGPAVDVIVALSMIRNGMIPPTVTSSPDASLPFPLVREPVRKNLKRVLVNSLSSEGQCASLIVEAVG